MLSSPGIAVRRTASLPLAYDRAIQYAAASQFDFNFGGILDHPPSRMMTAKGIARLRFNPSSFYAFAISSAAKCPRRCSQASRIRLGTATTTQIMKNSGHPVAFATKPAPDDR